MSFINKYNCILCKYNKYNKGDDLCFDHKEKDEYGYVIEECKSLSNIYYGTMINYFPFKQIHNFLRKRECRKEEQYSEEMDKKYGDYSIENDDFKFVWGVKSYDDLTSKDANLYTMNDIDIVYDKQKEQYMLGIETAYEFKDHISECNYLRRCLNEFTKYMDTNGLKKDKPYNLFFRNPQINTTASTIEDLYTYFKIFVDGFCKQYEG